jgi:hypothetical protein
MNTKSTPVPVRTPAPRKAWVAPRVEALPRLTNLTLSSHTSGDAVDGTGDVNSLGGSVFG